MTFEEFGSEAFPLRPSKLDKVIKCPVQAFMFYTHPDADSDEGGVAAQTGSVAHLGFAAFHQTEGDIETRGQAGLAAMQAGLPKFPLCEYSEAEKHFVHYANDPRCQELRTVFIEKKVQLTLEPYHTDPTKMPVYITGTLDMVSIDPKWGLIVDDWKTGKTGGFEMLHSYAYQLAAYTLAAKACLDSSIKPGRIIRTYGYRTRGAQLPSPDGVFWHVNKSIGMCWALMENLVKKVAQIRSGELEFGPDAHCNYCPAGGTETCQYQVEKRFSISLDMAYAKDYS